MAKQVVSSIRLLTCLLIVGVIVDAVSGASRVGAVRGWYSAPDCVANTVSEPDPLTEDLDEQEPQDFAQRAAELVRELPPGRQRELAQSLVRTLDARLHYTCKDEAAGEYVVRYPEGLGTEFVSESTFVEFRIQLSHLSEPEIEFEVEELPGNGGFRYSYQVFNKAGARRPIRRWSLVANSADDSLKLEHPEWRFLPPERLAKNRATAPQAALFSDLQGPALRRSAPLGKRASWSTSLDEHPIQAGESSKSFIVTSRFRPGWTTAYVAGGTLIRLPGTRGDLPSVVRDEISILGRVENKYSAVLLIGPQFGPLAERGQIARNWYLGIQKMLVHGWLSDSSPYAVELLHSLEEIARSEGQHELSIDSKPSPGMETLLDKIVRMAL